MLFISKTFGLKGSFTLATFVGDNASHSNKCLYFLWPPWACGNIT
jgi:hypothetical protein